MKGRRRNGAPQRGISESETLRTIQDGKEMAVDLLRGLANRCSLEIIEIVVFLVHKTAVHMLARAKHHETIQRDGWTLFFVPRPERGDPGAPPPELLNMEGDKVPVIVCAGEKNLLTSVSAEDLLPPSEFGPLRKANDGVNEYLFTLRQSFFLAFTADEDELSPSSPLRARLPRFREAVRAAVSAELARPGPKRPLIDIVFEVVGGPALEVRGLLKGELAYGELLSALEMPVPC